MNQTNTGLLPISPLFFKCLFFLLFIFIISSCEKDPVPDNNDPEPNSVMISHVEDLFIGDISGIVIDENEDPIQDVKINIRGKEVFTDNNGYFSFINSQLDATGTLVQAIRENYWSLVKLTTPSKIQKNQIRLMLKEKKPGIRMDSEEGGEILMGDVVKIDFPPNAFVGPSGDIYNGKVDVFVTHIAPNSQRFGIESPGDFRAFNEESELQTLLSLGMAGVELRSEAGDKLQLATDSEAMLSIKVPEGTDIEEVPLWHLDEASGYWIEEGLAVKEGDFYVGSVSHFSWWNCDVPLPTIKLSGSVVNESNQGVAGLGITIVLEEDMWNLGEEYTGEEGIFCGWLPADENLIIQVKDECGTVFYEENIGSFSEDTVLEPFVTSSQFLRVCGTVLNCDSEPVTNGYAVIELENDNIYIPINELGAFCTIVNICDATSFKIYGVDLDTGLRGFETTLELADNPFNSLNLQACDQVLYQFRYTLNDDPEYIILDFTITLDDNVIVVSSPNEINGDFPGMIIDGVNWGEDDFDIGYYNMTLVNPTTTFFVDYFYNDSPSFELVEYEGIGGVIVFNMSGDDGEGNTYSLYVSGYITD